jgi:hypothetical protein
MEWRLDRKQASQLRPKVQATAKGKKEAKTKARQTLTVDSTWDIETEGWTTFVAGCLFIPGGQTRTYTWRQEEAFVDALLSLGEHTTWAFNGGRFDTLWLMRHVLRRRISDVQLSFSGSAIATLKIGDTYYRDAARVAGPMSLKDFAQVGGGQVKSGTGLPCRCNKDCGGYCSIKRDMPRDEHTRLIDYMVQDCRALHSVLDFLCTYCERHDLDLKPTIGASSWATAERAFGVPRADWKGGKLSELSLYQKVRKSYYGGRTQVLKPISWAGVHYDIHSAYPAAFANQLLPVGDRRELHASAATKAFASGKLGSYRAIIHVPECFFPPLPVRTRFRSAYPVGAFGGWWTGTELQAAMRSGATVGRIIEGVAWSDAAMVLAPLGERIWRLRDQARAEGAMGLAKWLKGYINSCSGKLSMRPESETVVSADKAVFCPADHACHGYCHPQKCCEHRCTRRCGATPPLGSVELGLFRRMSMHLAHCSHVEWAAHVTAFARGKVLEFSGEDSVYCDTDSMFCEKERSGNIGPQLGQWGLEDRYKDFTALAPKTYRYMDAETGKVRAASKGIPDAVNNWELISDALSDGVRVDKGVMTFKSAIKAGDPFTRKNLTRKLRGDGRHFGDRVLRDDGRTWPVTVREHDEDYWELNYGKD